VAQGRSLGDKGRRSLEFHIRCAIPGIAKAYERIDRQPCI
jgi:hypothetical protein